MCAVEVSDATPGQRPVVWGLACGVGASVCPPSFLPSLPQCDSRNPEVQAGRQWAATIGIISTRLCVIMYSTIPGPKTIPGPANFVCSIAKSSCSPPCGTGARARAAARRAFEEEGQGEAQEGREEVGAQARRPHEDVTTQTNPGRSRCGPCPLRWHPPWRRPAHEVVNNKKTLGLAFSFPHEGWQVRGERTPQGPARRDLLSTMAEGGEGHPSKPSMHRVRVPGA